MIVTSPYTLSLPEGDWNIDGEKDAEDNLLYIAGPIDRVLDIGTHLYSDGSTNQVIHVTPGSEYTIISRTETESDTGKIITIVYDGPNNGSRYQMVYTE